jgi:hypothetical protein
MKQQCAERGPTATKRVPKGNPNRLKGYQHESQNATRIIKRNPCEKEAKMNQKRSGPDSSFGIHFGSKSIKNAIENSNKNRSRNDPKFMLKGFQNGTEIDAKTH